MDNRRCECGDVVAKVSTLCDRIDPAPDVADNAGCEYLVNGCRRAVDELASVGTPVTSIAITSPVSLV